jgi:hypothetical protein
MRASASDGEQIVETMSQVVGGQEREGGRATALSWPVGGGGGGQLDDAPATRQGAAGLALPARRRAGASRPERSRSSRPVRQGGHLEEDSGSTRRGGPALSPSADARRFPHIRAAAAACALRRIEIRRRVETPLSLRLPRYASLVTPLSLRLPRYASLVTPPSSRLSRYASLVTPPSLRLPRYASLVTPPSPRLPRDAPRVHGGASRRVRGSRRGRVRGCVCTRLQTRLEARSCLYSRRARRYSLCFSRPGRTLLHRPLLAALFAARGADSPGHGAHTHTHTHNSIL